MESSLPYLRAARTVNEPKVHPLVRDSFVFVPSVGMRLAPEVLVLELFRETFFDNKPHQPTKELDPDRRNSSGEFELSEEERAVLYALRGRARKSKLRGHFFAPSYPHLARYGWFRSQQDLVIGNFLFAGPIKQYLWGPGLGNKRGLELQKDMVTKIVTALRGKGMQGDTNHDILAAALGHERCNFDLNDAIERVSRKTAAPASPGSVMHLEQDELATQISEDLLAICELEGTVPRMHWIQVLMTFLSFAPAIWLLAQMRITTILRKWLGEAIDKGKIVPLEEIKIRLCQRNKGLLSPTLVPTRQLFEQIESYMKARIEMNILLYCLETVRGEHLKSRTLSVDNAGRGNITLEDLFLLTKDSSSDIRQLMRVRDIANDLPIHVFLTREGELFQGWRNALNRGQGRNIDELFRVLRREKSDEQDAGHLFSLVGRGMKKSLLVFPGPLIIKTMVYLAAYAARDGGGKLLLQNVEEHFEKYGIDFSSAADARQHLMQELQALGMLTGSPDAGASVSVASPYPINRSDRHMR